jgi:type IV pilus assembly protein PilV
MNRKAKAKFGKLSRGQGGYSLIEVLVSTLVISIGTLGMAGLQITAKRAGHEAVQRSTAVGLTAELLEKLRANSSSLTSYTSTGLGGGSINSEPTPACNNSSTAKCSTTELAQHDLWAWERSIDGASELSSSASLVGGLLNPTACVSISGRMVTIALAWEGYQEISNPGTNSCGAGSGKYGTADAKRQLLVVNSYIGEL